MGLFNYVNHKINCPFCGELITDFQTKDGDLTLRTVEFYEVDNFYSSCDKCGTCVSYTLKLEIRKFITLDYYNLKIYNPNNKEDK